jgi:glycerophosphoryl diester phosphodiesterase
VLPVVVAHRGASAHEPEQTLAAYERAIADGAAGLECDVRLSGDGHLVCVHDRRVDRTSTGRGAVGALPLEALRALDFGDGRGVLTLRALLELVGSAAQRPTLFVETKHPARRGVDVEAKLVTELEWFGLTEPCRTAGARVVLMSFSAHAVYEFRRRAPRVPTVLLLSSLRAVGRDGRLPRWVDIAGPDIELLRGDPDYVRRARAHGHGTYCWTVDEPADVELCRDLGVDYVATDDPGNTRRLLSRW